MVESGVRKMTEEMFQVRRLASPEEFLQATEKRAMEYNSSGKLDRISLFAADKNGFFACQLVTHCRDSQRLSQACEPVLHATL